MPWQNALPPHAGLNKCRSTAVSARALVPLLLLLAAVRPAVALELEGQFVQGGLVIGSAADGATVSLAGKPIRVSPSGRFLFGFGRDFKGPATLAVRYGDGRIEERRIEVRQRQYQVQRIDGLPKRMVTPNAEAVKRIRRENAGIAKVRQQDTAKTWFESGFILPAKGRISGVYGSQRVLNGEPRRPHYGLDIAAPIGTPVVAPADGRVALAETDLYFTGGTVMLDHGHGLTSVYSHLSSVEVAVGAMLRQGERLGAIGSTGRATGAHLDWRLNWFAERLDPALLVPSTNNKSTR